MTRVVAGRLYRHRRTLALYRVVGLARPTEMPNVRVVVYTQIKSSALRADGTKLAPGSMWTRLEASFRSKFDYVEM